MYTIRVWASPRHYVVDPRLRPSGNPFKYHVEALSFTMKQYIITTMLDVVLHTLVLFCFCF